MSPHEKLAKEKGKKRTILLVDDDTTLLKTLSRTVEEASFNTMQTENGKSAIEVMEANDIDAIVSDIRMPIMGGIELFHYFKKNFPYTPFIMMTGFHEIIEVSEAYSMGVDVFLSKPFSQVEFINAINSLFKDDEDKPKPHSAPPPSSDEHYFQVNIQEFISGSNIEYPIYIKLSSNKFVKVGHTGEDLSYERIQSLKDKGVKYLYLLADNFKSYINFNTALSDLVLSNATFSSTKKANFLKHTSEIILKYSFKGELDNNLVEMARDNIESSLTLLDSDPKTSQLLKILGKHEDPLFAHSMEVSLIAGLMAKKMGWMLSSTYFKLTIAGLFHDIGKKDIDPAIYSKDYYKEMSGDERKIIEQHPIIGADILSKIKNVPDDVAQIILHHHENCDGSGFPNGLSRSKIHPLALIISVANTFCNLTMPNPHHGKRVPPAKAINLMQGGMKTNAFDRNNLQALREIFLLT